MKFNKIIALAVALGTSFAAFAQDAATTVPAVEENDYWFAGIGGGMNFGFNGREFVARNNSGNGAGFAMDVYFGKWFNDWAGFRAGYQGLATSDIYTDFHQRLARQGLTYEGALYREVVDDEEEKKDGE